MSRYNATFCRLAAEGAIGFIPFAVAGDPDISASERIFKTYLDAGADILEIGYPFSDPVADGPVNQRAGLRAIRAGLDHARFFRLVSAIRRYAGDTPIGVLLYANTARHIGYAAFCRRAAQAGVDSLLVADMPPEEAGELAAAQRLCGLESVYIVSELTPAERMRRICRCVTGFVYVVSRLGPTGTQSSLSASVAPTLARLHRVTDKPLCVGFGLTHPDHIRAVAHAGAQGAIVGSALVETVEKNLDDIAGMLRRLRRQAEGYARASRSVSSISANSATC